MEGRVGYLDLVRENANYRNLWLGQVVSLLGDWFNLIASAALIASLTQSGLAVGGLFVIRMLAPFLVSPIAGVVADRYNRKVLLILTDLARAVIVLGFIFVREPAHVWILYVLTGIQLAVSGFFYPARSAILPDVVSQSELGAANALGSATWSIMLSLGAALGGFVAGSWGIYPSFIIDAGTFLVSAFFISRMKYHPSEIGTISGGSILVGVTEYIDGIRYLVSQREILVVSLLKAANSLATGAFQVLQVYLAERIYVIGEGGSTSLGLMYALVGAGTGLGPIWARIMTRDEAPKMRIAIFLSFLVSFVGLALVAPFPAFWLVLLGTFLRGFGGGVNWVFSTQLLLQSVPKNVMGRVFSTEFAIMTLASAAAAYAGGWGIDQHTFPLNTVIWGMAAMVLIFGFLWAAWVLKNPKRILGV